MRRNDGRHSRASFFSEGLPRFHLSGLYIHSRDGGRSPELLGVGYVQRLPVRRPTDNDIARFQARNGTKGALFERPDSQLAFRTAHSRVLTIGRDLHSGNALGSHRLGVAGARLDHVIASTMANFNPPSKQPLSIGKKPNLLIAHGIMGKLPLFASS